MSGHNPQQRPTYPDIAKVGDILYHLASEYLSLAKTIVTHHFSKENSFQREVNLQGTGINAEQLFENPLRTVFTLPPAFQMGDLTVTYKLPLGGAYLMVHPEEKALPDLLTASDDPGFDLDEYHKKESDLDDSLMLLELPCKHVPKGYVLAEKICVNEKSAPNWLDLLGVGLDYYIAAVEPLVTHRIISPTFGGVNRHPLVECICPGGPHKHDSVSIQKLREDASLSEKVQPILSNLYKLHGDFEISLAELRRAGMRHIGAGEELNFSTKQLTRTRASDPVKKAVLQACYALTTESQGRIRAKDVHARVREINPAIMRDFDPSDISHAKRALMQEFPGLKFVGNTCRIKADCLSQIGQIVKSYQKPKKRKRPVK